MNLDDVNYDEIIKKDKQLVGNSNCGYSTSTSKSCTRVGDDKVSCATLLEIIRNCSSKKPVKIFSKTINTEDDATEGDSLSFSSSSSSWSSSSSFGNGGDDWGLHIGRAIPDIFGWADRSDHGNHSVDPFKGRGVDPFSAFQDVIGQFFHDSIMGGFGGDSHGDHNGKPTFKIERFQFPEPRERQFEYRDSIKNREFVPPHRSLDNQPKNDIAKGPIEEI